ncbi:hypothetical protein SARC_15982, partial [Sphaeroforma arctica JP610]
YGDEVREGATTDDHNATDPLSSTFARTRSMITFNRLKPPGPGVSLVRDKKRYV